MSLDYLFVLISFSQMAHSTLCLRKVANMAQQLMWQKLESELHDAVGSFPGVAGVCVQEIGGPNRISINGSEPFPTASTIKIHVLAQLFAKAERGELDMRRLVVVTDEMRVPGSGILSHLQGHVELTLYNLAVLMIALSDNTATNLCIDLAGMEETNNLIRDLGLTATTLRRKMQDPDAIAQSRENVSTPDECVAMLMALQQGRPSSYVARETLEILKKPKDAPLNKVVPASVPVANKPGGMDNVQCDAGIVYLPRKPYAVAVMTKHGMIDALEHRQFIVDTSRLVHETMSTLDATNDYGLGLPPSEA